MIPQFPEFKNIEISDRDDVKRFLRDYPPYSDFDFTTLWSWDVDENRGLSMLSNNLIVRFSDYLTGEVFYSFLGANRLEETVKALFDFALLNKHSTDLRFVPHEVIPEGYAINDIADVLEDPDNHDYIYSTKELSEYHGSKYAQARNLLSRFNRRNGSVAVFDIDLADKESGNRILGVTKEWQNNKGKYVTREELALKRLIDKSEDFDLVNFGVMVDDVVVAFAMNEVLYDGYAISHFAQANIQYPGAYSFLIHTIAERMYRRGCNFLNYEQDLGLPGLRQAKKSYCPTHFLKKYSIVARQV